MGFILSIIALFFSMVFVPFGIMFALIKLGILGKFSEINSYFFKMAVSIDQFDNVSMQHFFNATMIKKGGIEFGNEDETMSSVYGKNKQKKTLTWFGKFWASLLNGLQKRHVEKAIEKDEINELKK